MSDWELRVSQRELHRLHVVRLTIEGRESVGRGAKLLGISARQMKRLRRKMKERGIEALLHGNRGKQAWNKTALENKEEGDQVSAGSVSGVKRYALNGEAQRQRADQSIAAYGAQGFASSWDRRRAQARGEAALQEAGAKSPGGSAGVMGR